MAPLELEPTSQVLPTLLCSRPLRPEGPLKRQRPTPVALDIVEEDVRQPPTSKASQEELAPEVFCVKNTFIEGAVQRSPSLDGFYRERAVHTCPSKDAGRLLGLMERVGGDLPAVPPTPMECQSIRPPTAQTPCHIETPTFDTLNLSYTDYSWMNAAAAPPHVVAWPLCSTGAAAYYPQPPPPMPPAPLPETPVRSRGNRRILSLEASISAEPQTYDPCSQTWVQPLWGMPGVPELPAHYGDFLEAPIGGVNGGCSILATPPPAAVAAPRATLPPPPAEVPRLELLAPAAEERAPPSAPPTMEAERACASPSAPAAADELPSIGSAGHAEGTCRPCAFLHSKGCEKGKACTFCHLCDAEEKKKRRKAKLQLLKAQQKAVAAGQEP